DLSDPPSLGLRLAVVGSAIGCCVSCAGLAFGFSALVPELLELGAFHEECPSSGVCHRQITSLTGLFTTATSLLNLAALPSGFLLDLWGPRRCGALFCGLVAAGCWRFGAGNYQSGFLALAVGGPCIFNCTLSFGNLFPSRCGLVVAALVGAFDASSAVFAGLALALGNGASFERKIFRTYAGVPTLCAVAASLCWPAWPVALPENEPRENEPVSGKESFGASCRARSSRCWHTLCPCPWCASISSLPQCTRRCSQ
ncbi:unnamed protein product, partial [Effrenium voratum]